MKYKFASKCLLIILLLLMVVGCGRGESTEEANGEAVPETTAAAEEAPPEEGAGDEAQPEQPTEEANAEAPPEEGGTEQAGAGEAPTEEAPAEEAQPEQAPEEAQPEQAPEEAQPEQAPEEAPAVPAANLTGQWDLNLNVNQWLFSDGRTEDTNVTARILASLTQNGTQLSGNFLEVSIDGFDDACTQASITGSILEDNQVKWTMNYSGDCCPGQQISFLGTYDAQANTLTGSFTPLGTPPSECRPWFADVTGSQR